MKNIFVKILFIFLLGICYRNGFPQQNSNELYPFKFTFQDVEGKNLKGIRIICNPIDLIESLTTTICDEGQFIAYLKPGKYRIVFESVDRQFIALEEIFNVTSKNENNSAIVLFKKIDLYEYYCFKGYIQDKNNNPIENASISIDIKDTIFNDTTNSIGRYFVRYLAPTKLAGEFINYSIKHKSFLSPGVVTFPLKANDKIIEHNFMLKKKKETENFLVRYKKYNSKKLLLALGITPVTIQKGEITNEGLLENYTFSDLLSLKSIWYPLTYDYIAIEAEYNFHKIPIETVNQYETFPGNQGEAKFNYTLKNFFALGIRIFPFEFVHLERFLNPYLTFSGICFCQKPNENNIFVDDELFLKLDSKNHFDYKLEGGIQVKVINNWVLEAYCSFLSSQIDTYKYQFNYFGSAESISTSNKYSNLSIGVNIGYFIQ